jgi:hypothetical protein
MNEITRNMSATKDQCLYLGGGGLLKRSSRELIKNCAVSRNDINTLGSHDINEVAHTDGDLIEMSDPNDKSFIWMNIVKNTRKEVRT